MNNKTIFVSIASYRDAELNPTIDSLLSNAANPNRIRIGVFAQVDFENEYHCIAKETEFIRQKVIDYRESKGACWARSKIQTDLMGNEDYYFQIDSHSRFVEGWDTKLIKLLETQGDNAVISTYPAGYDYPDILHPQNYIWFYCKTATSDKLPYIESYVKEFDNPPKPMELTAFIAGGFYFTHMATVRKVPYDPYLYFFGEEISLAARLYTHGFNVYIPNIPIMWHKYNTNNDKPVHWTDHTSHNELDNLSRARIQHLFSIKPSFDKDVTKDILKYNLGTVRSLRSYQVYSGFYFKTATIEEWCKTGKVMLT